MESTRRDDIGVWSPFSFAYPSTTAPALSVMLAAVGGVGRVSLAGGDTCLCQVIPSSTTFHSPGPGARRPGASCRSCCGTVQTLL